MPQIVVLCLVEHAKYSYSTVVYIPFSAEGKLAHLLFPVHRDAIITITS